MTLSVDINLQRQGFTLNTSFEAPDGLTALFGHSGSGKTTVIDTVAGLIRPDAGHVRLDGRTLTDVGKRLFVSPHKRRLGYVFQEGRLFPHLSVKKNLLYGGRFSGVPVSSATLARMVDLLGIGDLLDRAPMTLSGGQQQRVAIGRALLAHPDMLLLDEPLAALDERRKNEILPYLERLRDEAGVPMLYVSHSIAEVARLATRVVVLTDGQVTQIGAAKDVFADPLAADDLGDGQAGAVIAAKLVKHLDDGLSELVSGGGAFLLPHIDAAIGSTLRIRILARDVMLSRERPVGLSALNILSGTVTNIHKSTNANVMVQMACGNDLILSTITQRSASALDLETGASCHAIIKSVSVILGRIGNITNAISESCD